MEYNVVKKKWTLMSTSDAVVAKIGGPAAAAHRHPAIERSYSTQKDTAKFFLVLCISVYDPVNVGLLGLTELRVCRSFTDHLYQSAKKGQIAAIIVRSLRESDCCLKARLI